VQRRCLLSRLFLLLPQRQYCARRTRHTHTRESTQGDAAVDVERGHDGGVACGHAHVVPAPRELDVARCEADEGAVQPPDVARLVAQESREVLVKHRWDVSVHDRVRCDREIAHLLRAQQQQWQQQQQRQQQPRH
jgi:hypothetical protein